MKKNVLRVLPLLGLVWLFAAFIAPPKPVFYLVGDSTTNNPNPPWCSWGQVIFNFFDTTKLSVQNRAIAGRSTRQFINEGRWAKIMSTLKPGDFVIVEFGHNAGGKPDTIGATGRRAVLKGNGDDSVVVNYKTGREVVHSYGWYLRKFAKDAQSKGATVMIASMVAGNAFKDGKVMRNTTYGLWAKEAAQQAGAFFIDANNIIADKLERMGPEIVKEFHPYDGVHTNAEGAGVNAAAIIAGIKKDSTTNTLNKYLAFRTFPPKTPPQAKKN